TNSAIPGGGAFGGDGLSKAGAIEFGARVRAAKDGRGTIEAARHSRPTSIGCDGKSAARRIRSGKPPRSGLCGQRAADRSRPDNFATVHRRVHDRAIAVATE